MKASAAGRDLRLMEVCGTHTVAIFKTGLRALLPSRVTLLSGPGCPVCVTPAFYIERALALAGRPGVTLATFGDLLRVPGKGGTLAERRRAGADVRAVYSPLDAVELAAGDPGRTVVFLGVGFETTAPTVAAAIETAADRNLANFLVLNATKTVPAALRALLALPRARIDGFILPGHVSAVLGATPYRPLFAGFGLPAVICGFEGPLLEAGVNRLIALADAGAGGVVENAYPQVVREDGNPTARRLTDRVFEPADADWRGIGVIPGSGLAIRARYAAHDAAVRFPDLATIAGGETPGCRCGEVLTGRIQPPECGLYGTACTPAHPVGPCMVSSEGTCAAWHRFGGGDSCGGRFHGTP